jgi:hypothetical protein
MLLLYLKLRESNAILVPELSANFTQVESWITRCDLRCPSPVIPSGGHWWSSAGQPNPRRGRASPRSARACAPWWRLLPRHNNNRNRCFSLLLPLAPFCLADGLFQSSSRGGAMTSFCTWISWRKIGECGMLIESVDGWCFFLSCIWHGSWKYIVYSSTA